jgi:hypothetical protein
MKRTQMLIVVLATMCGSTLVTRAEASDNVVCSNETLQGSYGFQLQGTIFATGLQGGVGIATFDGNGRAVLATTFVNQTNGVRRATGTSTYVVNPDCTGYAAADLDPTATYDMVIVDGGNEIFMTATRGDRVVNWAFKKQRPQRRDEEDKD